MRFSTTDLIIILVIVVLLFGAPKLPALAKSLAESLKIFRGAAKDDSKNKSTNPDDDSDKPSKPAK